MPSQENTQFQDGSNGPDLTLLIGTLYSDLLTTINQTTTIRNCSTIEHCQCSQVKTKFMLPVHQPTRPSRMKAFLIFAPTKHMMEPTYSGISFIWVTQELLDRCK